MAGNAFFPRDAKIYIGAASAASSSCTQIQAYVTSYKEGGFEADIKTIYLFGNASIDQEPPRTQGEITFDVIVQSDKPLLFDQMIMGSSTDGTTAVDSSMKGVAKVIYVELLDSAGTVYATRAYNNARGINFDPEVSVDEFAKGTINFKVSPTTSGGTKNLKVVMAAASTVTWP